MVEINVNFERYCPRLKGGWIEKENWSLFLPNDDGKYVKHYGLPEDYEKYFIVREHKEFIKPRY